MSQTIEVPLWLLILILLFAAVTFASHFLFPSVRWFFRKRAVRVIARLNQRLTRPIEPFKIARRYDMIHYLYTTFYQATQTGVPLMRPMWMEFADEAEFFTVDSQFMLGDYMLVAPKIETPTDFLE